MTAQTGPPAFDAARDLVVNRLGDILVLVLPDSLDSGVVEMACAGFSRSGGGIVGVVLDCSGIDVLDLDDYRCLERLRRMFSLLGARTVFMGLKPGVVAALISLGCDGTGLDGVLGLENALAAARTMPVMGTGRARFANG